MADGRGWTPRRGTDQLVAAVTLFIFLLQPVAARALEGEEVVEGGFVSWGYLLVVGVGGLVCGILLIVACAGFCDREAAFKVWEDLRRRLYLWWNYRPINHHLDFENEESFVVEAPPAGPAAEFSMYPPVESTPDPMANSSVYFEPLPDLTHKLKPKISNATILRPKVGMVTARMLDREDSDDGLEDVSPPRDNIQDKMKLQALVTNSKNLLPRSQLQYIKELGTGYFGKVLQGEGQRILPGYKKTKVVIQMLNEEADPHDQLTFLQEAAPYREIDHPNVLKVLGQCVETVPYLVVLELCPFGDLKTYLRSHRVAIDSFSEKGLLLKFASDMAAGLQALHQHNFVHHDFASRNCLLASDLTVKVGDYGLSEETFKEDYYFDGNGDPVPIRWLAPESLSICQDGSLSVRNITKEANVWSYGVAMWEVVQFGALPYSDLSNEQVLKLVVKQHIIHLSKPDMPITHLDRLYQLMQLCWSSPAQRPSLRELRIMLLHLLSQKRANEDVSFEQKWNQLLPRHSVKAAAGGPIATVASPGGMQTPLNNPLQQSGFESNFVELDVSLLASKQAGAGLSLEEELSAANQAQAGPVSANELSLEAELCAAANETDDDGPIGGKGLTDTNNQSGLSLEQELSAVKTNVSFDSSVASDTQIIVTNEDELRKESMPDIVTTSNIKTPPITSPDFVTSTPRGGAEQSSNMTSQTFTTTSEGATTPTSIFHSALTSQTSNPGEEEETSLFGQKKFAAILQTVAAPSFDGDEYDLLSSSFGSSLDRSIDEVFNEFNTTPTNNGSYQKVLPSEDGKPPAETAPPVTMATTQGQGDSLLVSVNGESVTNGNQV